MDLQGAPMGGARPGGVSSVVSALSVRKPEVQIPRLAALARDDNEVQIPRLAPLARDDTEVQIPRLAALARDDSRIREPSISATVGSWLQSVLRACYASRTRG